MTYVTVVGDRIVGPEMATPPPSATDLITGAWIVPAGGAWTPAELAAAGITEVTPTPRPHDTATTTHDRSVRLVDGDPVETWTPRAWTDSEAAARAEAAARQRIHDELTHGIAALVAARQAAEADADFATTLQGQAEALAAQVTSRTAAVSAWTPKAVYTAADLTAIKGEVIYLQQVVKVIVDAIANTTAWRRGVDGTAILTGNSILWTVKTLIDDPLADEN